MDRSSRASKKRLARDDPQALQGDSSSLSFLWGRMRVVFFIGEPKAIDMIIHHFTLSFQAEQPPPPQIVKQELLMAAEER